MNRYANPSESFAPLAVGLTLAIAIHLVMLPMAIVAMKSSPSSDGSARSSATFGTAKNQSSRTNASLQPVATELPPSPKVSQSVQEHARRSASATPTHSASANQLAAVSLKKNTPPKLRLGSRTGDPYAATAAWISYEDFQKLQAPKGRQEQPALQKDSYPTPGAPYRPDSPPLSPSPPSPASLSPGSMAVGSTGSSGRSSQNQPRAWLLYPPSPHLPPPQPAENPANANSMRWMPNARPAESIIVSPMADLTATRPPLSPFPPLTSARSADSQPPFSDAAKSPASPGNANALASLPAPRSNHLPAESVPGQTAQAKGQVLLTPNPGSSTTPSNTIAPSSTSPSPSPENAKPASASPSTSGGTSASPANASFSSSSNRSNRAAAGGDRGDSREGSRGVGGGVGGGGEGVRRRKRTRKAIPSACMMGRS